MALVTTRPVVQHDDIANTFSNWRTLPARQGAEQVLDLGRQFESFSAFLGAETGQRIAGKSRMASGPRSRKGRQVDRHNLQRK